MTADRRSEPPDPADLEARSALVEELERLPERLRSPLVACHLEGLTQQEAAARLHCPLRTLQRRLAAGRERLRHRLTRRGLGSSPVAALGGLADGGLPAAPGWALATVRAAVDGAAAGAAPAAAALARVTIRSMTLMTAFKLTASALTLSAIAALGLVPTARDAAAPPPPDPVPAAPLPIGQATTTRLTLTVVDGPTGRPLEGLSLDVRLRSPGRAPLDTFKRTTDADGTAPIVLPDRVAGTLAIGVREAGYVPVELRWSIGPGRPLPSSYTLRLDPGTTIGGRLVDEQGRPIEGAKVLVWVPREDRRDRLPVVVDLFNAPVTTDAEGRWQYDLVPPDLEKVMLNVEPPGFIPARYFVGGYTGGAPPSVTIERLRDRSAELVLKRGLTVFGRVRDDATGDPIAGAAVRLGTNLFGGNDPATETDADGRYRFTNATPGFRILTVQAAGHAPQATKAAVGPDPTAVDFRLGPGRTIRGRVVGPDGEPIPGAGVTVDEWLGKEILFLETHADADGWFALEDAPDGPVVVQLWAEGYMNRLGVVMSPADEPRDYALDRSLKVAGAVTDARTASRSRPSPSSRSRPPSGGPPPPSGTTRSPSATAESRWTSTGRSPTNGSSGSRPRATGPPPRGRSGSMRER